MSEPVNWEDPCARATALRAAYFSMISGQHEIEIRTRTLDAEEMVRFDRADVTRLQNEIAAAERECALVQGRKPVSRRHAITAGFRRHPWGC